MQKIIIGFLAAILLLSLTGRAFANEETILVYSQDANSGVRHETCTTLDGTTADTYYTGEYTFDTLSGLSGDALLQSLRQLMISTHTYETSYDECRDLAVKTDCENGTGDTITLLYSSFVTNWQGYINNTKKGWNREHVWPKSLGGFSTSGAGADLHHIRPTDSSLNGTRGNLKYGVVTSGSEMYGTVVTENAHGGKKGGGYMEPLDNVKGDVARICLYVWVRYGGELSKCSSITNVFESVDVLLEWHEMDPVDTWEMGRNEVVYGIQGNRNVFIDYPELAWLIFDREVPEDVVTPSANDRKCEHATTEAKDLAPTCDKDGYTGSIVCADCGKVLEAGTVVPATGHQNVEHRDQKDATCSAEGFTGDTYCVDCGQLVAGASVIPTTDHTNTQIRDAREASCKMAGSTGDTYCLDCGKLVKVGNLIPATGEHTFGEWEAASGGAQVRNCTVCGFEELDLEGSNPGPCLTFNLQIVLVTIGASVVVIAGGVTAIVIIKKKKIA